MSSNSEAAGQIVQRILAAAIGEQQSFDQLMVYTRFGEGEAGVAGLPGPAVQPLHAAAPRCHIIPLPSPASSAPLQRSR